MTSSSPIVAPNLTDVIDIPRVWERLNGVETRLLEASTSEDPFLTEVAQHLLLAGGKRYRPLLALLGAEAGDAHDAAAVDAGASVELIHVGSLYHDDIIDGADTRRGAASANASWSDAAALLAGDFLLARASEVATDRLGLASVRLLAQTYAELATGQSRELTYNYDTNHQADDYLEVMGGKTASLIRTSMTLGAQAAGCSDATVQALTRWGWEVGIVFQIADDALDLVATEAQLGKPAGSDIIEGKFTLPVLAALADPVHGPEVRSLLESPRPYATETVERLLSIVRGGFVEASIESAVHRLRAAEADLEGQVPDHLLAVLLRMGSFLTDQVSYARATA